MSEWLTRVLNESEANGITKGRAEGRAEGTFDTLAHLVRDHLLPVSEAAKRCNMTEVEFCQKAGIQVLQ